MRKHRMADSTHRKRIRKLVDRYCVTSGDRFRLKRIDPGERGGITSKAEAARMLADDLERLRDRQEALYARSTWSLLLIFQAMDAAGKDSTIKHVISGVDPQGCEVHSFKAPSSLELRHDFLWRTATVLPERGRIGIFNRSYYEEVLVVRVHPEFLSKQNIPGKVQPAAGIWDDRFEDITAFERHLHRSGTKVLKFFLHVSKEEQRKRFVERLDDPGKHWKFSEGDLVERRRWREYMTAYQDMIRHTASKEAPWFVVPADHKWFTRLVVAAAIVDALDRLDLKRPPQTAAQEKAVLAARAALARKEE